MSLYFYRTPIGRIGICEQDDAITHLYLPPQAPDDFPIEETPLLKEANAQLTAYFDGVLKKFDLPLQPGGTEFQKEVWNALCQIEYGQTVSYQDIAHSIGRPNAARAVGHANNQNPIPIFIPCHRVIGKNGSLVGYGGGLEVKRRLLDLEQTYR